MSEVLAAEDVAEIFARFYRNGGTRLLGHSLTRREQHGYLGVHLTLTVRAEVAGAETEATFFVKTYRVPPKGELDFIGETGMFRKEVLLYSEAFERFSLYFNGPRYLPKYYYSKPRVLVMEDLSADNFRMSKDYLLDREHLELVVEALAAFHASSVVFEEREKRRVDDAFPDCFVEFLNDETDPGSPTSRWKERQMEDLLVAVDLLGKYSEAEKALAKRYLVPVMNQIYPLSKKSARWRNVVVHGDMWNNNLLFAYEDGHPVRCKLVDYQFSRYAPPMHDLMHLLHLTADKRFRDAHELALLSAYHEALGRNLAANGIDVNAFCPFHSFSESRTPYRLLAIIQALLSMHYLLGGRKAQEDPHLRGWDRERADAYLRERRRETVEGYFADPKYVDRVGGILCELIDDYVLDEGQRAALGIPA